MNRKAKLWVGLGSGLSIAVLALSIGLPLGLNRNYANSLVVIKVDSTNGRSLLNQIENQTAGRTLKFFQDSLIDVKNVNNILGAIDARLIDTKSIIELINKNHDNTVADILIKIPEGYVFDNQVVENIELEVTKDTIKVIGVQFKGEVIPEPLPTAITLNEEMVKSLVNQHMDGDFEVRYGQHFDNGVLKSKHYADVARQLGLEQDCFSRIAIAQEPIATPEEHTSGFYNVNVSFDLKPEYVFAQQKSGTKTISAKSNLMYSYVPYQRIFNFIKWLMDEHPLWKDVILVDPSHPENQVFLHADKIAELIFTNEFLQEGLARSNAICNKDLQDITFNLPIGSRISNVKNVFKTFDLFGLTNNHCKVMLINDHSILHQPFYSIVEKPNGQKLAYGVQVVFNDEQNQKPTMFIGVREIKPEDPPAPGVVTIDLDEQSVRDLIKLKVDGDFQIKYSQFFRNGVLDSQYNDEVAKELGIENCFERIAIEGIGFMEPSVLTSGYHEIKVTLTLKPGCQYPDESIQKTIQGPTSMMYSYVPYSRLYSLVDSIMNNEQLWKDVVLANVNETNKIFLSAQEIAKWFFETNSQYLAEPHLKNIENVDLTKLPFKLSDLANIKNVYKIFNLFDLTDQHVKIHFNGDSSIFNDPIKKVVRKSNGQELLYWAQIIFNDGQSQEPSLFIGVRELKPEDPVPSVETINLDESIVLREIKSKIDGDFANRYSQHFNNGVLHKGLNDNVASMLGLKDCFEKLQLKVLVLNNQQHEKQDTMN